MKEALHGKLEKYRRGRDLGLLSGDVEGWNIESSDAQKKNEF